MKFDPENKIIKLCSEGMEAEGMGDAAKAKALFMRAWAESSTDLEKFTAAHYVARHQNSAAEKLLWDEQALHFAQKITDKSAEDAYPSLYLNIAKGYEDVKDLVKAKLNYELALSFSEKLPDDGYSNLVRSGIKNGIKRLSSEN